MDREATKWNYTVWLGRDPEWWRYFAEYNWMVNLIFRQARQSEVTVIARPQLFLIRHTLEIGYKMNIIELEKVSGLTSSLRLSGKQAHNLEDLHQDLNRHFRELASVHSFPQPIIDEYDTLESNLRNLKDQLHKLDQWSYSFRYPVGTDGSTPSLSSTSRLNMMDVQKMYVAAEKFLKYTTDVVAAHLTPSND